ncbi:MAG: FAD-dependent thymidylate synthase [Solirubrobacteraceae bacterium]
MRETSPQVFLIARPSLDVAAMRAYLKAVGGESWLRKRLEESTSAAENPARGEPPLDVTYSADEPPAAELLVEFAGRLCYRSWEPGLNPNVTRVRSDRGEYFANILASGHGSVLEHASWTFVLHEVSRAFTHELVRHRVGCALSQESLRYVRLVDIGFRVPPALQPLRERVLSVVEQLEDLQISAANALGVDGEDVPFAIKKEITSALRRLAPIGLSTDVVWTANARTLRHVIELRTDPGAEEEMRLVFDRVAQIARAQAPEIFQDFTRTDDGAWIPAFRKV